MTITLPIIDITALRNEPTGPEASMIIEGIDDACTDTGFFGVTGHGLGDRLDAVFEASRTFFALPQDRKEQVPRVNRYGFVPLTGQTLDPERASNIFEHIDIGLADEITWPDISGFAPAVRAYQRAALATAATILRALAIALDADPSFFAARMTDPQCRLRLVHYPVTPMDDDGSLPVLSTPHTDYGAITLLATDGVPGLEVKPLGGDWTPVSAPLGSLVVNLGDMLARWTNDRYRSTPHRVVGAPDRDRFSVPFFVNPDPGTVVDPIPSCVTAARPCRYEPVTAGDFLTARIDGSYEPYVCPQEGPTGAAPARSDLSSA